MGLINYIAKFMPKISEETKHLRELEKKNVLWHWENNQQTEFDNVKKMVCSAPILAFFDPDCDISL